MLEILFNKIISSFFCKAPSKAPKAPKKLLGNFYICFEEENQSGNIIILNIYLSSTKDFQSFSFTALLNFLFYLILFNIIFNIKVNEKSNQHQHVHNLKIINFRQVAARSQCHNIITEY